MSQEKPVIDDLLRVARIDGKFVLQTITYRDGPNNERQQRVTAMDSNAPRDYIISAVTQWLDYIEKKDAEGGES